MHWQGFGIKAGDTRTLAHVFPVATGITSPYPVQISLAVFTREFGLIEKTLDHGRCGQPGGVWWEDQFPELKPFNGLFGCSVKIHSKQSHILLNSSQAIIEFFSEDRSVRFIPSLKSEAKIFQSIVTADPRVDYSVVLLNTSEEKVIKTEVFLGTDRVAAVHLPANAVYEVQLAAKDKDKAEIASISADGSLAPYLLTKRGSKILAVNRFEIFKGTA